MGMVGVTFGDQHSYDDWHVYVNGFHVEYPTPRRLSVNVALRNGMLDVTNALTDGKIYYENRKITVDFVVIDNPLSWQTLYSKIARAVHGKSLRIIYDMDPYFYWEADNCIIVSPTQQEDVGSFSIECDCKPYKHELDDMKIVRTLWGEGITIDAVNLREEVVPTINVTAPAALEFNDNWYSLDVGDNWYETVELKEGSNILKIYNRGTDINTITITYRRGDL